MDLSAADSGNENKAASPSKKKYIVGYKHKLTGKIFYNAKVQTLPLPWKYDLLLKFHRDSQTVTLSEKSQQTPKNASTQVQARNIFISSNSDKFLEAKGNFIHAEDIKKELINKIIILQKYARSWLARQELVRRKDIAWHQHLWDQEELKQRIRREIQWNQELDERRLNPRTEDDFKLLFSDLQKWWEKEAKKIDTSEAGKIEAMILLESEVKKILAINNQRNLSKQEKDFDYKEKSLEMAAHPKLWKAYNFTVEVENYETLKGKYLHEIHQALSMKCLSSQDRINILTSLKEMLQPYHTKLTDTLVCLANREIDLILRGTREDRLDGLRNRIQNLFWQFAKQPIHNPQMSKFKKISVQDTFCCTSCNNFFTMEPDAINDKFLKSNQAISSAICEKCLYIENEAWIRKDLEFYKKLLKMLIFEEEKRPDISGIIYILRPNDIKYIVDKVWRRQSCISGLAKEDDLELIRYNFDDKWTPWNCMLVTKEEAQTLQKTPNLKNEYDHNFKEFVAQRHAEAKTYFSSIPRFLPYIFRSNLFIK